MLGFAWPPPDPAVAATELSSARADPTRATAVRPAAVPTAAVARMMERRLGAPAPRIVSPDSSGLVEVERVMMVLPTGADVRWVRRACPRPKWPQSVNRLRLGRGVPSWPCARRGGPLIENFV